MLFGKMSEQDMIKFLSVQELLREINSTYYRYQEKYTSLQGINSPTNKLQKSLQRLLVIKLF